MTLPCRVAALEHDDAARFRLGQLLAPDQERACRERAGPGIAGASQHGVSKSCAPSRLIVVDLWVPCFLEELQHLRFMFRADDFLEPDKLTGVFQPSGIGRCNGG